MADIHENSKRIAKNTILLYIRMIFLMLISLYTSRVILNALGIEDFGIYNVIGGFVVTFSVISGSLSAAITRFLNFELGRNEAKRLIHVFSSAVSIQIGLAVIIAILANSVGLWFLYEKMVIPLDRMNAALWVFEFSVFTFCINLISVPYNAAIIAHEKMGVFAYISLLEGILKLGICYFIQFTSFDRLIFYAILMASVSLVIRFVYGLYCKKYFVECRYHFIFDKNLLKQMFGFAGWNFIGASSAVLRDQGGNVVINLFAGPSVNAARGISMAVSSAVSGFVTNFMTALSPQITKSFASGEKQYMLTLIFQGARLSYYMLLFLSLPIILNTHFVLQIWLKIVPDHAVLFTQLVLIFAMSESISNPLITAMLATGRIRNYQIVVGGLQMMNLPLSYILLKIGLIPETVMIVAIFVSQVCFIARLIMLRSLIGLNPKDYLKRVYFNIIVVTVISLIIPTTLSVIIREEWINFIIVTLLSFMSCFITILYIGCNSQERSLVFAKIHCILKKLRYD